MGYSWLSHLVSPSSQWGSAHVATGTSINMTDALWGKQGVIINGQLSVFSCYFIIIYIYIYIYIHRYIMYCSVIISDTGSSWTGNTCITIS